MSTALLYCGEALWSATLLAAITPAGKGMYRWMTTLVPGSTVIEITTARSENDSERIGTLIEQGNEWVAYTKGPGGYWEDYTLIRTMDGREVRWSNCRWVRIPVTRDEYREARNHRNAPERA